MQWLNELPFADNRVLQIGFLAACGIAALIVLAIVYRLTFAHRLRVPGGRTRQPRLGLVDAFSLDGQRQLVLIRRDNIEHLVMIGGPNDVLVELQINRAVVPARESQPGFASACAKHAGAANRSRRTPCVAGRRGTSAEGRRQGPGFAAPPPAPVPAAPAAPTVAPPIPKAPAPAQPPAPAPAQPAVPDPAAQRPNRRAQPPRRRPRRKQRSPPDQRRRSRAAASGGPAASRTTARDDAPADHPRQRLAESRGAGSRYGNSSRKRPGQSPGARLLSRLRRRAAPEKAEPAVAGSKAESIAPTAKTEPPAAPTVTTVPPASAGLAQARPAPKTAPSAPASDWARKSADARPPGDKTNAAPSGKPSPKVDDPFADLDSLEAEMARLLGREKSD